MDDARIDVLVLAVSPREHAFEEVTRYRRLTPTTKIVGIYRTRRVRNEMIAAGVDATVDELDGLGVLLAAVRRVAPFDE